MRRNPCLDPPRKGRPALTPAMLLLGCLLMGTAADPARAQEVVRSGPRPADARRAEEDKASKRSLLMQEIESLGEVEKPKTMFVIPRAPHRYNREEDARDFTDEILAPINRQWVEDMRQWKDSGSSPQDGIF